MKPGVTICKESFFYRVYGKFYSAPPEDTCGYRQRLLSIILLKIPLVIFSIVSMGIVAFMAVYLFDDFRSYPPSADMYMTIGFSFIGALILMALITLVVSALQWLCSKYVIVKQILQIIGLTALACLLSYSMFIFITGQFCSSDPIILTMGILGAIAWCLIFKVAAFYICGRIFDSSTYKTLKASAKEKWCAKIVVVDKDGNEVKSEKKTE